METNPTREGHEPSSTPGRGRAAALVGVGAVLAAAVGLVWLIASPEKDGLREVVTVDAAGDTLVYSGPVRDAIARARIIEAFNSVPAPEPAVEPDRAVERDPARLEPDGGDPGRGAASEDSGDAARLAREAAVDALARLYTDEVEPGAILSALGLAILDFEPGEATLPHDALPFVRSAAGVLDRAPDDVVLVVVGYAVDGPAEDQNLELSERRARAVVDALVRAGVEDERLRAEGRGSEGAGGEGQSDDGSITFELEERIDSEATGEDTGEAADEATDEAADSPAGEPDSVPPPDFETVDPSDPGLDEG